MSSTDHEPSTNHSVIFCAGILLPAVLLTLLVASFVACGDPSSTNNDNQGNQNVNQQQAVCGDGVIAGSEACDDGAANSDVLPDACRTNCRTASCSDGVVDSGEGCDEGAGNSDLPDASCRTTCALAGCGDGIKDYVEECDDANAVRGDGCEPDCLMTSFSAAWSYGPGKLFAVGQDGAIVHFDGTTWEPQPTPTTDPLFSVWGTGPNDVFAGMAWGGLLHFDGTTWSEAASPVDSNRLAFWGSGPSDVFSAGGEGEIVHWDGASWSVSRGSTGPVEELVSIWGSSPNDVWAAGNSMSGVPTDGGVLVHFDGVAWSTVDSGATESLMFVGGTASDDVYVVSWSGVIHRWDGKIWTATPTSPNDLYATDYLGFSSDALFVYARSSQTMGHWDGSAWAYQTLPITAQLMDLHGTAANDVFAVGEQNLIFHFDGTAWTQIRP